MGGIIERIKHVPHTLWIGALIVIIAVIWVSRKASTSTSLTPTSGTVGSTGAAGSTAAAGSDQMLGVVTQDLQQNQQTTNANFKTLSDTFTSGLQQIATLESANQAASTAGANANTQSIVDALTASNSSTLAAIQAEIASSGSAFTALGQALQGLKQQAAVTSAAPTVQSTPSSSSSSGGDTSPGSSGPGGRNTAAAQAAADIGTHSAIVNGAVVQINKTYAAATQSEKAAMNAFANGG